MTHNPFLHNFDALAGVAFAAAGLASGGTYQLGDGPVIPCPELLVDESALDFGDDVAPVGTVHTLVTIYRRHVPRPERLARVTTGGRVYILNKRVRTDESLEQWVVSHG